MSVVEDSAPMPATVRVGSRRARVPGPLGSDEWESEAIGDRREHYQEVAWDLIPYAHLIVHGDIPVPCRMATRDELETLDRSLALVPPGHLQLFLRQRPGGILVRSSAGRGTRRSYSGGLNPVADDPDTPEWNEREMILVTHGAFWQYRRLSVCPTVLHEIGHRMTTHGEINWRHFPPERARVLQETRVSRNPGRDEALCNVYMYFLCWASPEPELRDWAHSGGLQSDLISRDAMRPCAAFRAPLLDERWAERMTERAADRR